MLALKILIGSTRKGRAADRVIPWVLHSTRSHGAFDVDVLDLRDWPLPMFAETRETLGDLHDPTYSEPIVKQWNKRITAGDVFLFLTPEYNHSVPGVLKNAIDSVFNSHGFRNKAMTCVSYSSGIAAGIRAIEHLAHMAVEAEMVPIRNTVPVPNVLTAFEGDRPRDRVADAAMRIALDDLAWWGAALKRAREAGELVPGGLRLREAMLAAAAGS